MVRSFGVGEIKQSVQPIGEPSSQHRPVRRMAPKQEMREQSGQRKENKVTTSGWRTAATADSGTSVISPLSGHAADLRPR
jgi:hypothetical protein